MNFYSSGDLNTEVTRTLDIRVILRLISPEISKPSSVDIMDSDTINQLKSLLDPK